MRADQCHYYPRGRRRRNVTGIRERSARRLGYRVLSAANGRAALEVWAEHQNEIDLLLTDVVMPESISGRELAHTLVMDKPDLKVIFTSGYSAELIGTDFEQEKRHAFLAKPYLPDRLAQTVAAHLQSQPAMTASHTPVLATA